MSGSLVTSHPSHPVLAIGTLGREGSRCRVEHSSLIVGAAEVVGGGTMDGWGGMGLGRMDGRGDRGRCVMGLGRYGEGPAIAIIIQVTRGIDQRPANWPVSAAIPAIWNLEKGKRSKWSCATISVSTKK